MADADKIRILVDVEADSGRPALPGAGKALRAAVEVSLGVFESQLAAILPRVFSAFENATAESTNWEVDTISFSLIFDATGEISVLSVVNASLSGQTGFTVTIRRKADDG
jgi:hypothetical protein